MISTTLTRPLEFVVVNALPTPGEPLWDADCQEWVLTDSDGISYLGATPGECYRQFGEALHVLVDHAHKSPELSLTELRGCRTASLPPWFVEATGCPLPPVHPPSHPKGVYPCHSRKPPSSRPSCGWPSSAQVAAARPGPHWRSLPIWRQAAGLR
jgi:hypothetical protein